MSTRPRNSTGIRRPGLVVTILAALALMALPATATATTQASAAAPVDQCAAGAASQYADPAYWQAPGNYIVPWYAKYGIYGGDGFRVYAYGTTRVDFWGANKDVAGDPWIAPNDWPAPGVRQYALIAKVNAGTVYRSGRSYGPNQWFEVGRDSGCFSYSGPANPQLQFGINDPNIGDNGGGPWVYVKQWW
jgi:hypothetical protein